MEVAAEQPPVSPLDALAAQHGARSSAVPAAAAAPDPLDLLAAQHGALQADFHTTNARDAQGHPTLADLGLEAVKGFASQFNPIPLMKHLYDAESGVVTNVREAMKAGKTFEAARQAIEALPISGGLPPVVARRFVGDLLAGHWDQLKKAADAYQQGHLSEAVGHTLAAVVPLFGPPSANIGEEIGTGDPRQMAHGAGGAAAMLAPIAVKELAPATVKVPAVARNPNAAEAAAADFGVARGIPVDAGTASGNAVLKGARQLAEHTSLTGATIGNKARATQAAAFTRVGDELANDVHPSPVTPEQAGAAMRGDVKDLIKTLHQQANAAYDKLRAIEDDPTLAQKVIPKLGPDIAARMEKTVGRMPTTAELLELHRIKTEMENMPFVKRTWNEAPQKSGNAAGGDADIVAGSAGAPVYDDILQHAPGTSKMTRGEVTRSINAALTTGQFTNAAKGALEVAALRLKNSNRVTRPQFPAGAGTEALPSTPWPVDLSKTKEAVQPIYARLKREAELVPLQGDKAKALTALDRLITGPDLAPLSTADAALSDLKRLSRGAALPELRSVGQGVAAKAVRELDTQVRATAAKAGPGALQALEEGRAATKAKHQTADVLDSISEEPVQAFRQATWAKDAGIDRLRSVADVAPQSLPKIGRAYIEDLLQHATSEGGFDRGAKLFADWQKLGPETKKLLFGSDADQLGNLDNFFLLAKKASENPNPSGTAYVGGLLAHGNYLLWDPIRGAAWEIGAGAVSKMLRSPAAVKALTKGFTITLGNKPMAATVSAQILKFAGDEAVPVPTAAAGREDQRPTTSRQ